MCNTAGEKAPPLIIYKGKYIWNQRPASSENEFPDTMYAAILKGGMEGEIFKSKTIIPTIGSEQPVLIIYDGHSTQPVLT